MDMPNKKVEKLEWKCLFCMADDEVGGLVRVSETIELSSEERDESIDSFFRESYTKISYECSLGKTGKDCIIPIIYSLLKDLD